MSKNDKPVVVSTDGAVQILRLNRPDQLNALDDEMLAELLHALQAAERDSDVRVVILIGVGRSFMSGADLTLFKNDLEQAPQIAARLIDGFHAVVRLMRSMTKPVIAAIHGAVAGGGAGLALACDLCVMADDAKLISVYSKIGASPDGGTTWSFTQLVGRRKALEIMWLNDPISAQQALALGLANKVVAAAALESETLGLAKRLAEGAPAANARVKQLVNQAAVSDLDAQLDREKAAFVTGAGGAEFREGVTAFFERRPARY